MSGDGGARALGWAQSGCRGQRPGGRDKRKRRVQVGGQVDIRVGEDLGLTASPHLGERTPGRAVRSVPGPERELPDEASVQRRHGARRIVLLVVHVRAPRGSRAIGWEEDVDLDGNPPVVFPIG
jgi:hypothetical protein